MLLPRPPEPSTDVREMSDLDEATDGAEAVRRFAARLRVRARKPERIQARLDGADGMAGLCAVESAIADLWPNDMAKELVWLTRTPTGAEVLHLQAFAADGEVLGDATFRLRRNAPK
jgi:hypothetical protein